MESKKKRKLSAFSQVNRGLQFVLIKAFVNCSPERAYGKQGGVISHSNLVTRYRIITNRCATGGIEHFLADLYKPAFCEPAKLKSSNSARAFAILLCWNERAKLVLKWSSGNNNDRERLAEGFTKEIQHCRQIITHSSELSLAKGGGGGGGNEWDPAWNVCNPPPTLAPCHRSMRKREMRSLPWTASRDMPLWL